MAVLPPDPVFTFKSDMGHIHSMCFSVKSDNYISHLLAATEKGIVYFWDLETNRLQHKQEMGKSIQTIHCYKDFIITQEKSGQIKLWTTDNGHYEVMESYECCGGYCKSIVINDLIVVPQENSTIDILDIKTLKNLKQLVPDQENLGYLMALEKLIIYDKMYILGGYETGHVILWELESCKTCSYVKLKEQITSLTFDVTTCRGVCGNSSNVLQVFAINKSTLEIGLKCELSLTNEGCNIVKLRHDKKLFVTGGWDGKVPLLMYNSLRTL